MREHDLIVWVEQLGLEPHAPQPSCELDGDGTGSREPRPPGPQGAVLTLCLQHWGGCAPEVRSWRPLPLQPTAKLTSGYSTFCVNSANVASASIASATSFPSHSPPDPSPPHQSLQTTPAVHFLLGQASTGPATNAWVWAVGSIRPQEAGSPPYPGPSLAHLPWPCQTWALSEGG